MMNPCIRKLIENKNPIYVNPKFDDRTLLMNFLEANGYKRKDGQENSWGSMKESVFPIGVNFLLKEVFRRIRDFPEDYQ